VQESASEAQALNGAGRECADLAVESFGEFELSCELDDSIASFGRREMVQAAEEEKIFAAGKAGIKTLVAPCVIAELAANGARSGDGVVASDIGVAGGGQEERGKYAKKSRFARAVCAEERERLPFADLKRNVLQSGKRRRFERLEERPPAGASGRE